MKNKIIGIGCGILFMFNVYGAFIGSSLLGNVKWSSEEQERLSVKDLLNQRSLPCPNSPCTFCCIFTPILLMENAQDCQNEIEKKNAICFSHYTPSYLELIKIYDQVCFGIIDETIVRNPKIRQQHMQLFLMYTRKRQDSTNNVDLKQKNKQVEDYLKQELAQCDKAIRCCMILNPEQQTLLDVEVRKKLYDLDFIKWLLILYPDAVNNCDTVNKITPIFHTLDNDSLDVLKLLLQYGANQYHRLSDGRTFLECVVDLKDKVPNIYGYFFIV